jgi:hypothetical protein
MNTFFEYRRKHYKREYNSPTEVIYGRFIHMDMRNATYAIHSFAYTILHSEFRTRMRGLRMNGFTNLLS